MMEIKAYLEYKPTEFRPPVCRIKKVIELNENEFSSLADNPCEYRDYITENRGLMRKEGDVNHCILALDKDGRDGILIEAEGYDFVRYGAYVPHAGDYVENELRRMAALFLKDVEPDLEASNLLPIFFEDMEKHLGMIVSEDSDITRMFCRTLREHPAIVEITAVDKQAGCIIATLADTQHQEMQSPLKLRDVLLLGDMENVYMVHDTADIGFVPASYTAMLTAGGRREHADLLSAPVKEIRPGAYGPEIVLTGIDPELLVSFDQAAAAHIDAEFRMGDPTM